MQSTTHRKENPLQWLIRYVKEARQEMKKVTWPSKKVTTKYSVITIVLSILTAIFFGGLDWILTQGLDLLVTLTN